MAMKLDEASEENLNFCKPGVGVIFMKVAENEVMMIEFYPRTNNTLRTSPSREEPDSLHDWIDYVYYNLIPKKSEVKEQNGKNMVRR